MTISTQNMGGTGDGFFHCKTATNPEFREAAREQMRLKNQLKDANQWLKLETKP